MKKIIIGIVLLVFLQPCFPQLKLIDSLKNKLAVARDDRSKTLALSALADYYGFVQFDSCLFYATQEYELAEKLNYDYGKFLSYRSKFFAYNVTGNFPMALQQALNYEKIYEQLKKNGVKNIGVSHYFVGFLNLEMGDYPAATSKLQQSINQQKEAGEPMSEIFFAYSQMGVLYLTLNRLDSALWYAQRGYDLGAKCKIFQKFYSLAIGTLGAVHVALHHYPMAEDLFKYAIRQSGEFNNIYFQARSYYNLAKLFDKENLKDSAIYFAGISLRLCLEHNFAEFTLNASKLLTKLYDSENKADSTLKYMRIELAARDSVFSQSKVQQFRQVAFDEVQRQQKINTDKERYQNKIKLYSLLVALIVFLMLAFLMYRNSMQRKKANSVLHEQKKKVEITLSELKSTQQQLIQSEKMASLGELTAGIAHEIQNPLNFVNNFSEVNKEMISEMKEEIDKGNYDEVKLIAKDIEENEEKINHHGKRADAIVKGMLQHSKQTSGTKEPTDINALCDEYLRLSYHGLRAKDKSFNADFKTEFDESIGKINIVPQDIGRVLLNLFNNAFYAVNEKAKSAGSDYKPAISVSTKRSVPSPLERGWGEVFITVTDNGNGIPQNIIDKIFQPFFTTKPTGQGTGLGLSLAYDIITKEHGGTIKVESKENQGSVFIIGLAYS